MKLFLIKGKLGKGRRRGRKRGFCKGLFVCLGGVGGLMGVSKGFCGGRRKLIRIVRLSNALGLVFAFLL